MDPTATLARIRELVKKAQEDEFFSDDDLDTLIELQESLDHWISSGGFLPEDWQPKESSQRSGAW